MKKKPKVKIEDRVIAVIDFETDPFLHGRPVAPFAWGFYDGEKYEGQWHNDATKCVKSLLKFLREYHRPLLIYAHNGGKFDFMFFIEQLENPLKIINGRIVEARLGEHVLRDSYAIFPDSLSTYKKDDIDYRKMERDVRHKHKVEIMDYLRKDCEYLHNIVSYFVKRFGPKLTIGATAIGLLRELCPFPRTTESHDTAMRPYYFGGRCEAFESGIIHGDFKIIDVNSMYPDVMRNRLHPLGMGYTRYDRESFDFFGEDLYFIKFDGTNNGALPTRTKTGLDFNVSCGTFWACSHEIKVALFHGLITIDHVHEILVPDQVTDFSAYVDKFIDEKIQAKKEGDKLKELFAKRLLNSAYGKTGQNPENHGDYMIVKRGEVCPRLTEFDLDDNGELMTGPIWELYEKHHDFNIYSTPTKTKQYYDVAIAASITSAARAKLLDAKMQVVRPIYCDTDSLICEDVGNLQIDDFKLGAWAVEARPKLLAIAGKKLYAAFHDDGRNNVKFLKGANKGVQMHPSEIVDVCEGKQITCHRDAPNIKISGEQIFTTRKIKNNLQKQENLL